MIRARKAVVRVLCVLALTAVAGCSGVKVAVDAAPDFAERGYRDYAWASAPLGSRSDDNARFIDRTVRTAAERELQARGYRQVEAGASPLLLDYRVASRLDASQSGVISPRDEAARVWDLNTAATGDTSLHNHPVVPYSETLFLSFSLKDRESGKMVWQGVASQDGADPDRPVSSAVIERAVRRLVERLPAAPH